jgi:hypothetical protein
MDFLLPGFGIVLLVLIVIYNRTTSKDKTKQESNTIIEEARLRSKKRREEFAFADTQPLDDPYLNGLELNLSLQVTEVDERAIGHGDLTDEQKEIITLIFDGYGMPIKKDEFKHSGPTARIAAGVPWANSVFADENIIEVIESKDPWANVRN